MVGGVVILFGVGTSVQAGWVLAIAALLGGLLMAGVVLGVSAVNGVDIARLVPRTATAGQPLAITIDVANTGRRPRALLLVSDDFCGTGTAFARFVRPGQSKSFRDLRDGCRRGTYESGRVSVESGFPFGVVRARRTMTAASPLVVYPKTYDVASLPAGRASGWRAPAAVGDVASVRDYHPGDPLRHIHWRSVARRGELVVREFDRERRAEVAIVAKVPDESSAADAIASVATSFALASLRDAGEVVLISSSGVRRERQPEAVLDWGARLDADDGPIAVPETTLGVIVVCMPDAPGLELVPEEAIVITIGPGGTVRPEEVEQWLQHAPAFS